MGIIKQKGFDSFGENSPESQRGFSNFNLQSPKGFTLIELLVVIAIIAILVAIVIVAINPVERLNEANDRRAASNVRATGTLLSACMVKVLSLAIPGTYSSCDTQAELDTYTLGKIPTSPVVTVSSIATDLCATQQGRTGQWWQYRHTTGTTAQVPSVAAPAC